LAVLPVDLPLRPALTKTLPGDAHQIVPKLSNIKSTPSFFFYLIFFFSNIITCLQNLSSHQISTRLFFYFIFIFLSTAIDLSTDCYPP